MVSQGREKSVAYSGVLHETSCRVSFITERGRLDPEIPFAFAMTIVSLPGFCHLQHVEKI